jgi:mRNA interferase RelE/StbE
LAWTVEYTETAKVQLRKLDKPIARRVMDFMGERVAATDDPRQIGKALTGQFSGLWRYRVGDVRVICTIEDGALRVLVVRIGNRREVYR